jgi:D-lactate dehydrogenase
VESLARGGLRAGRAAAPLMRAGAGLWRSVLSDELVPTWPRNMPPPAPASLPETSREGAAAVYLPACVNRIFGRPASNGSRLSARPRMTGSGLTLPEAMVAVSARAGMPVWIPEDVAGNCCSVPWNSKGYTQGAELMANRTVESLWRWSGEGELPVVIDASSCALGLSGEAAERLSEKNRERHEKLEILDSVVWAERLLPKLEIARKLRSVAVHPTCSTRHMGQTRTLAGIAGAIADQVFVPIRSTCCGMAGDRGLLHPELTEAAIAEEAAELAGTKHDAYLCSNRTCEIALQQRTCAAYESFVIPLELASRP